LLAVVPFIAANSGQFTLEEIAAQFNVPLARLEKDLSLLGEVEPVALSNVYVWEEDDGRMWADGIQNLGRPLRLTASDAFSLVASANFLVHGPRVETLSALRSALQKVAAAIGGEIDGLEVHVPKPPALEELLRAKQNNACVEIEYYSAARDDVTKRVVEPLALFAADGRWHMIGFCHTAQAERDFRVDRVRSVRETGESFEPREPTMRTDVAFDPHAENVVAVRIEVQPEQRWAVERYPVRDVVDREDGTTEFTVDAAGDAWLERLLLRLGPTARVLDPPDNEVGRNVAARLLARYES
jgi:proteasome accessory factor C